MEHNTSLLLILKLLKKSLTFPPTGLTLKLPYLDNYTYLCYLINDIQFCVNWKYLQKFGTKIFGVPLEWNEMFYY